MNRQSLTEKIIVLGVDGFDPSLAKKFMDQGLMPNLQSFVSRGSAKEDLVLLGGMPTGKRHLLQIYYIKKIR